MTSSNSLRRRAGPFGSGSRSPFLALPAARAAASALAFAARSAFTALSVAGALSAFGVFSAFAFLSSLSAIDLNSRALGHPDLLVADDLEADAGRLAVLRIGNREVRQMNRRFLGDDAAVLGSRLRRVALDQVNAANQRAIGGRTHLDH